MGALRAAELFDYGMIGYGAIYRWYRMTAMADDDEVAVLTAPQELGSMALTNALVDMRISLKHAVRENIIPQGSLSRTRKQSSEDALLYANLRRNFLKKDLIPQIPSSTNGFKPEPLAKKSEDARGLLTALRKTECRLGGDVSNRVKRIERSLTLAWIRDLHKGGSQIPAPSEDHNR